MALYWIDCTHCLLIWLEICICSCGSFVPSPPEGAQQVAQPVLLLGSFHSWFFLTAQVALNCPSQTGEKKNPIISVESSIATCQQLCRTYGSYVELPITNLKTGGENEPGKALKDWVHSPGHLSPSSVPYLDSIFLSNNNSNTPFEPWRIHRP